MNVEVKQRFCRWKREETERNSRFIEEMIQTRSLLSIHCIHFIRIFVCLLEAYGYRQNIAVPPEIVGAASVSYSYSKSSKTQWRKIFWKNVETFCAKTVQGGTELQTYLWCYLAQYRDRQLQQNSWEGRDRTGNECQLDGREEEVVVRVTLVCSLRGALYWMYCITSIKCKEGMEV